MTTERKPRARKPKSPKNAAAPLLDAIKFVSIAQRNEGTIYQTHCAMYDDNLVAFDGALSAGCKIESALKCCPHTLKLSAALARCGEEFKIDQTENGRLSIKSGAFRALIPCAGFDDLIYSAPDEPRNAVAGQALIKAFERVAPLCTEGAQEVHMAAVYLNGRWSVIASNGAVLFEAWHGLDMPPGLLLPKSAVTALLKTGKTPVKFGFTHNKSLTFWFDDGSWLKSQLYDAEYPDVYEILNKETNAWPIVAGFYDAVDAVAGFSENDSVYFQDKAFWSHADAAVATSYEIEGLPTGPIFAGKYLKMLQGVAERIDFTSHAGMAYFFGNNVRGVVMGRTI